VSPSSAEESAAPEVERPEESVEAEVERPGATVRRRVWKVRLPPDGAGSAEMRAQPDLLATEEPLEIRLQGVGGPEGPTAPVALTITMRTPGHDFELAAGFLFGEGLVRRREEIARIDYCLDHRAAQRYNTVSVRLRAAAVPDAALLARRFYTTSSCGVCGKASLEMLRPRVAWPAPDPVDGPSLAPAILATLPARLRDAQGVFDRTGGLHAAGLFDAAGGLLSIREDVGRHNALDKLIGEQLLAGRLPLARAVVVLSGRASFELVQKAAMAGVPVLVAVGAPSSLAAASADEFGITLAGFARGASFNVYTHPERIVGRPSV
jgi:FdhD protein